MASVFGTLPMVRIHGNLYCFLAVTSLVYSNHSQQYSVVIWFYIEEIFPHPMCAVHLESSRQYVASVFGIVWSVGIVTITTFVIYSNMSFI